VRGFDDLSKVTVWVDVGMSCNVQCDSLLCEEVEQAGACFQRYENGVVVLQGVEGESEHVNVLESDQIGGHVAVQVPGAGKVLVSRGEGECDAVMGGGV
jgi:hypothetical protein